jgi:hypothetical protein
MAYVTIEHDANHLIVVNTDLITYLRQGAYGTAVHFTSGEHIICAMELELLLERLGIAATMPTS